MSEDDSYGATIAKLRLSAHLTDLRLSRNLTASQVCARLGWGRGKLGRFEMNQWKRPELSDMRDLLRLYQADQNVEQRIIALAVLARRRPWWREYSDIFDDEFPGFENDACGIETFLPLSVPALLQTPAYAETHAERIRRPARWQARLVETILHRQKILARRGASAPRVTAVITEAALRYRWGCLPDRLQQIDHLIDMGGRPGIQIQVHTFAAGPRPAPEVPVCRLTFGPDGPDILFLDAGRTSTLVRHDRSQRYLDQWAQTLSKAVSPGKTVAYLEDLRDELS